MTYESNKMVSKWIGENAQSLHNLEGLNRMMEDVSVVGLGVTTRSSHELSVTVHQLFRFLVENQDFRTLALEEDWSLGIELDKYVVTGEGNLRELLHGAWLPLQTEELFDVIQWIRAYNRKHTTDPIRIVGLDITAVQTLAYDAVADYVERIAPERLNELDAHYSMIRPVKGIAEHIEWYAGQHDTRPFIKHAKQVHDLVESLDVFAGHEIAVQHARMIVSFYEYIWSRQLRCGWSVCREHHLAA